MCLMCMCTHTHTHLCQHIHTRTPCVTERKIHASLKRGEPWLGHTPTTLPGPSRFGPPCVFQRAGEPAAFTPVKVPSDEYTQGLVEGLHSKIMSYFSGKSQTNGENGKGTFVIADKLCRSQTDESTFAKYKKAVRAMTQALSATKQARAMISSALWLLSTPEQCFCNVSEGSAEQCIAPIGLQ